jgi:hypothetical protein
MNRPMKESWTVGRLVQSRLTRGSLRKVSKLWKKELLKAVSKNTRNPLRRVHQGVRRRKLTEGTKKPVPVQSLPRREELAERRAARKPMTIPVRLTMEAKLLLKTGATKRLLGVKRAVTTKKVVVTCKRKIFPMANLVETETTMEGANLEGILRELNSACSRGWQV